MIIAEDDVLDAVFAALADKRRRSILDRLAAGPLPMSELAQTGEFGLPSALKHLQVLERAGLVDSTKTGRVRSFALNDMGISMVNGWLEAHRRLLDSSFDRLQGLMQEVPEEKPE